MKGAEVGEPRYINRELSWLKFNRRVLEEAVNEQNPLLERLKFLAIFESNLDEFYMVRVSGLIEQFESGILEQSPDGLTPNEQLAIISRAAQPLRQRASQVFEKTLRPQLEKAGIVLRHYDDLNSKQRKELEEFFYREIFPLCTPLILHPAPSIPFISNRSLNLVVELRDQSAETRLARVKIPPIVPRAVRLPGRKHEYVLLEEIIAENLKYLFPGVQVVASHIFRVIRDADVEIRQLEAADLIATIEETLKLRRFGDPVLLEVAGTMPKRIRKLLMSILQLDDEDVFVVDGLIGMDVFWQLSRIDRPALRFPPHHPYLSEKLTHTEDLFELITARDLLLHHPYDSFRTVEQFVASAAQDPNVIGIKQTLYRVGSESPIVESLLDAAENQKQVAAMVELKARFDESNNLVWARTLERAGVHVTYGFADMKTHSKLCLVVRREPSGLRSYAHVGTGNYNPVTARLYTDLAFFTKDPAIIQDISELFNYLTGFSKQMEYRKLLVAPINLREGILSRIQREIDCHKKKGCGRIIFKLNALVDPEVVDALYEASNAGVTVDLIARGICCLRPGVPGMSENIRVISIVGRFLEHSRIYYFHNCGEADVLLGSADLMRRNLDRRIETLVPVEQQDLKDHIRDHILENCLRDNVKAWELDSTGEYHKVKKKAGEATFSSQAFFMAEPTTKLLLESIP